MHELQLVMTFGFGFGLFSFVVGRLLRSDVLGPFNILLALGSGLWFGWQVWEARTGQLIIMRLGLSIVAVPVAATASMVMFFGAYRLIGAFWKPPPLT